MGGYSVITTQATDSDATAPNNELIYRIDSGAKDKFRIDAQTGLITVESGADLDRDVYGARYTLRVCLCTVYVKRNTQLLPKWF